MIRLVARSFARLGGGSLLAVATACAPTPPSAPPAPVPPATAAPPAGPAQLARAALACPSRKGNLIATSCPAAAAFLAPGVLATPDGRRELFRLVLGEDDKGRALAAWGYEGIVTRDAPLALDELTAVLVVFGRESRLLVIEALAQSIRRTVLRDPEGPAADVLVAFLDDPGAMPVEDGGPNSREELLLGYDPGGRGPMGAVLFRSEIEWTRAVGRAAVLASNESAAVKCALVARDLARNGDPVRGLLDQSTRDCGDDPAPTITRIVDIARGAVVDDADVRGWPFENLLPLCERSPKLRNAIGAGLAEVAQPAERIDPAIRVRALTDLAHCDRDRAREAAKRLQRDRSAIVARAARALVR